MARIFIPSFEEVLEHYRPLWIVLYQAADAAMPEAAEKFRSGQCEFDGGVHAGNVRLFMRNYLDKHGSRSIAAADEGDYEREPVNNCGLAIRYRDIYVKIYKSDNGEMPQVRTKAQRSHYQQPEGFQPTLWSLICRDGAILANDVVSFGPLNLVAHWHVADPPSLRLENLFLALPNGTGNPPHWSKPLPNPVLSFAGVDASADTDATKQRDNIMGLQRRPSKPTGDRSDE